MDILLINSLENELIKIFILMTFYLSRKISIQKYSPPYVALVYQANISILFFK